MARGGINKALVQQALETLLSKGQNPSIDAVRVELGNTGSKSTIHRYLKELEEEASTRLDDKALLSEPIQGLITRLASRLHEEAQTIVTKAEEQHSVKLLDWKSKYEVKAKALTSAEEQITQLNTALETSQQHNQTIEEETLSLTVKAQREEQKISDLEAMIKEKDRHIASLEEKHAHSREALEHYRQSVKEQREQDARKYEHQVQQLQTEIHQLNQTLSIKQTDLTQLNKDNSRLVTELSTTQKALSNTQSALGSSENQRDSLKEKARILAEKLEANNIKEAKLKEASEALQSQYDSLGTENQSLKIKIAKLEAAIEIKNDLVDRMMPSKAREDASD